MARVGLQTFWIQKKCQQLYSDVWCNDDVLLVVVLQWQIWPYTQGRSMISKKVTNVLWEMIESDIVVFNHQKILF
jgi:hypothetical protein